MYIQDVMAGIMRKDYAEGDVFNVEGHNAVLYISKMGICIMGPENTEGIAISEGVMSGRIRLIYAGKQKQKELENKYGRLQLT